MNKFATATEVTATRQRRRRSNRWLILWDRSNLTRTVHLTTGTFNQVVKDRNRGPPERRASVQPAPHKRIRLSSKPFNRNDSAEGLSTSPVHRISTEIHSPESSRTHLPSRSSAASQL